MKLLPLLFLFIFLFNLEPRTPPSSVSPQGTSKVLSNGTYVSQTVGQQSVIRNYTKDDKTYGLRFQ